MTDSKSDVIGPFLLQPHVARVIVRELHDQHPFVLRQRRGNLLDQLLLPLNIHRRKQFVLVNGLQQLLVFVFALLFGVRKRRHVPQFPIQVE